MNRRADLNVLCWDGYESDAVLGRFANERGISSQAETLVSDAGTSARIAGGDAINWDVLNLNNPFSRDELYPRGLIRPLDRDRFEPRFDRLLPWLAEHLHWTLSSDGTERIGIGQRFGPFNIVINEERLSRTHAEDEGFGMRRDDAQRGRYAVLAYDDFNIHHICIDAGLNPFRPLEHDDEERFGETARAWFAGASQVTNNHVILNQALLDGEIDFYLSGGLFTAAAARLDGHSQIRCITPRRGPIDGKGGIAFFEVTSILEHAETSPHAADFLEFVLEPEIAYAFAFGAATCSPIAQMGDAAVFDRCTLAQLDAIQWDTIEEDVSRAAQYAITPNHEALLARLHEAMAAGSTG